MPKRIPCKVLKTRLYSRRSDLLIVKPWGEPSNLNQPVHKGLPFANKNFGDLGKLFNDLIRETGILDYYA